MKNLAKPDSELELFYKKNHDNNVITRTEIVFAKKYDEITTQELTDFCQNFIKRIYLIRKFIPMSLGHLLTGVLYHPNLSQKDYIVSNLKLF